MSGEFENIELTLPMSDYAQVIFHNIPETYTTDSDIECRYTVTSNLQPSSRDWVGIYKVGWRSAREYTCFDWSKMPSAYEKGQKVNLAIIFSQSILPKDDGEFYQFCYVTSSGHIRGASTPFQFRVPGAEEYVEVEDEEDDILVIKTKTAMLEDKLEKAEREKEELSKTIEYLEKEKETLLEKLIGSEKTMNQLKDENVTVGEIHKTVSESLEEQKMANKELSLLHDSLKEKITCLNQEKESCVKRLDESDDYIYGLQQKIKTLVNEKDALTGLNKSLNEEKEMLTTHFTTSEDQMKGYLVEMEELRKRLRQEEDKSAKLQTEHTEIHAQLTEEQNKSGDLQLEKNSDETVIAELTEKLVNCENKLEAAEKCKELIKVEVASLNQTLTKLSADLEDSKSESHSFKTQLMRQQELVAMYTDKINNMTKTIADHEQELDKNKVEYTKLKEMQEKVETKEKEKEEGAQFALNKAYETLRHRYEKLRNQKDETHKQLDEAMCRLRQTQIDKETAQCDMKERLRLGQEQYKERVIECQRLQKDLKRVLRANKATKAASKEEEPQRETELQVTAGECQTETTQMIPAPEVCDPMAIVQDDQSERSLTDLTEVIVEGSSLVEQTSAELLAQLSDLGHELENRQKKKQKYKNLYQDEKEKRAFLEKHYHSEMQKRDSEITQLKQQLQDNMEESNTRIGQLQMIITTQSEEIDQIRFDQPQQVPVYPPQAPYPIPGPPIPLPQAPQPHFYPPQMPPIPLDHQYSRPQVQQPQMFPPQPVMPYPPYTAIPLGGIPPIPPRNRDAASRSEIPSSTLPQAPRDPLSGGDTPHNLEPPLQPLPAPLSPQRSPDSMVAQIKAVIGATNTSTTGQELNDVQIPIETGEDEEDERYHDAEEAPVVVEDGPPCDEATPQVPSATTMRMCPVCNMVFPETTAENDIILHVETHMARVCPMCNKTFDDSITIEQFQEHVDTHFTESG